MIPKTGDISLQDFNSEFGKGLSISKYLGLKVLDVDADFPKFLSKTVLKFSQFRGMAKWVDRYIKPPTVSITSKGGLPALLVDGETYTYTVNFTVDWHTDDADSQWFWNDGRSDHSEYAVASITIDGTTTTVDLGYDTSYSVTATFTATYGAAYDIDVSVEAVVYGFNQNLYKLGVVATSGSEYAAVTPDTQNPISGTTSISMKTLTKSTVKNTWLDGVLQSQTGQTAAYVAGASTLAQCVDTVSYQTSTAETSTDNVTVEFQMRGGNYGVDISDAYADYKKASVVYPSGVSAPALMTLAKTALNTAGQTVIDEWVAATGRPPTQSEMALYVDNTAGIAALNGIVPRAASVFWLPDNNWTTAGSSAKTAGYGFFLAQSSTTDLYYVGSKIRTKGVVEQYFPSSGDFFSETAYSNIVTLAVSQTTGATPVGLTNVSSSTVSYTEGGGDTSITIDSFKGTGLKVDILFENTDLYGANGSLVQGVTLGSDSHTYTFSIPKYNYSQSENITITVTPTGTGWGDTGSLSVIKTVKNANVTYAGAFSDGSSSISVAEDSTVQWTVNGTNFKTPSGLSWEITGDAASYVGSTSGTFDLDYTGTVKTGSYTYTGSFTTGSLPAVQTETTLYDGNNQAKLEYLNNEYTINFEFEGSIVGSYPTGYNITLALRVRHNLADGRQLMAGLPRNVSPNDASGSYELIVIDPNATSEYPGQIKVYSASGLTTLWTGDFVIGKVADVSTSAPGMISLNNITHNFTEDNTDIHYIFYGNGSYRYRYLKADGTWTELSSVQYWTDDTITDGDWYFAVDSIAWTDKSSDVTYGTNTYNPDTSQLSVHWTSDIDSNIATSSTYGATIKVYNRTFPAVTGTFTVGGTKDFSDRGYPDTIVVPNGFILDNQQNDNPATGEYTEFQLRSFSSGTSLGYNGYYLSNHELGDAQSIEPELYTGHPRLITTATPEQYEWKATWAWVTGYEGYSDTSKFDGAWYPINEYGHLRVSTSYYDGIGWVYTGHQAKAKVTVTVRRVISGTVVETAKFTVDIIQSGTPPDDGYGGTLGTIDTSTTNTTDPNASIASGTYFSETAPLYVWYDTNASAPAGGADGKRYAYFNGGTRYTYTYGATKILDANGQTLYTRGPFVRNENSGYPNFVTTSVYKIVKP